MNAIQLFRPDGVPAPAFLCGTCSIVYIDAGGAARCCAVYGCAACGRPITDERGTTYHHACWFAAKVEEAEKLDEWDGWVFVEGVGPQDGYFESVEELLKYYKQEGLRPPEWVFACKQLPFPDVDISDITDHINDNTFEEAEYHLHGLDELGEALKAFNEANKAFVSYEPDYTRVVRADPLRGMNVFKMNDCDWVAAPSAGEALKEYAENVSSSLYQVVADGMVDNEIVECSLDEEMYIDMAEKELGKTTFRAVIAGRVARGDAKPFFIASTEY
jgi:hypothetical protein